MRFLQDSSIRKKLTVIVMLTSSVALFVSSLVFVVSDQITTRNEMVYELRILADILGANCAAAITFGMNEDASEVLSSLKAEPQIMNAHIYSLEGRELASYHRENDSSLDVKVNIPKNDSHIFNAGSLGLIHSIKLNNKPIGRIFLRQDLSKLSTHMNQYMIIMAIAFVLTAFMIFLIVGKMQRSISGPIGHLANVARRVYEKQDYSIRASQFSKDESGFLTEKFNEMLADIQERDAELHDAHTGLEKRVKERTIELEKEISKRKRVEEELQEAQEFLETAVAQSPAGILIADAPDVTIRLVNSAAYDIRGGDQSKLTAIDLEKHSINWQMFRPGGSLYPPDQLPLSRAVLFGEETKDEELIIRDEENNDHWVSVNAAPIRDAKGNVTAGIVILNDITHRRQAEEQKQELQDKLEKAERMESLGILAGGVAHDLNNMLGPIAGYSELILLQLDENDKMAKRVKRIGKSAQDAADVIQDLLTLARRGRYEMIPTDLNELVLDYTETPGFLKLTSDHPETKTNINLDKSIGQLMGSSVHLSKVVMNLIVNAFDAMPDGGTLTISTSEKHLDKLSNGIELGNMAGNHLLLSIADNGMGIEPEYLDKIFEPYYSKKKMGGSSGSGLGLSVVYGVLKDHKGFYDIISSPGNGTEFQLFFPITACAKIEKKKITTEDLRGNESILVVDDNDSQRLFASELLENLGYNVKTVASGEDAVEYLKSSSADLILLDMIMDPGIDGLDTYKEIIKTHPGQKAVIASGFSSTDRVEEMQKLGAGEYIKKPFSIQAIGGIIRKELNKQVESPNSQKSNTLSTT